MARARTTIRTIGLLAMATIVATGCGGGGDAAVDAAAPPAETPVPGATTPGAAVVNPAAGAIDPVTGQPIVAETPAATSIPTLEGDDIGGGLSAVGGAPIFEAGAISLGEPGSQAETETTGPGPMDESTSSTGSTTSTEPAAPAFGGAKIYVDGIVHDVTKGGTFPKGNPVFRLLSVSADDIEIELVAGEFSTNGGSGSILDKGELVSMLNTSESLTYRIKYLRPITSTSSVSFE